MWREVVSGLAGIVLSASVGMSQGFRPVPIAVDNVDGTAETIVFTKQDGKLVEDLPHLSDSYDAQKSDIHGRQRGDDEYYWPMDPKGTRKIIYYIVDMLDQSVTTPEDVIHENMRFITQEYFPNLSHGQLQVKAHYGGRFNVPFTNTEQCRRSDAYIWAEHIDAQYADMPKDENFLEEFDTRVYIFQTHGVCDFGGLGTTQGNTNLPNHDGFANQAWIMDSNNNYITAHEIGHNLGLRHATTPPTPEYPDGDEYGDLSSVMGGYTCHINPWPKCIDIPIGLHAEHLAKLGWLDKGARIITRPGYYLLGASEIEQSEYPQLLQILMPNKGYESLYLDYRTGLDNPDMLLDERFAYGLSVRRANTDEIWNTEHFGTIQTGQTWYAPWYYPELEFFDVSLVEKRPQSLLLYVNFYEMPQTESYLNPGSCSDGVNNDNDFSCDYNGCEELGPEQACVWRWDGIEGPRRAAIGESYTVTCIGQEPGYDGYGPLGDDIVSHSISGYEYTTTFRSRTCGTKTIRCGTIIDGAMTESLAMDMEIYCARGQVCDEGQCVPERLRRIPSHRLKPLVPKNGSALYIP